MSDTVQKSNPGPLAMSPQLRMVCIAMMLIGAITFAFSLMHNADRAWYAYLTAYFYFFILAIGGLFFTGIQHLTHAGWSVNVRRFCESYTAFLPVAAVATVVLFFGAHHIYEWMDKSKIVGDEIMTHKASYMNPTFFGIRTVIFFAGWLLFAKKMVGNSLAQDKSGDERLTISSGLWSVAFMLFFAISFSLFAVDIIMSLMPHFYSTIFGIYCFGSLFQSTMAAMILQILYVKSKGRLEGYVDQNHMHDLGKYMFAFTVFWAYIAYSQYMLIWYANLPEETIFYIPRVTGGWTFVSAGLLIFKFIVPFMALLSRRAKRNAPYLASIAVLILVMHYVDMYWLIYPNYNPKEVVFGLPEILIWVGFAGAFVYASMRFLSKNAIIPLRDPRIQESLHHHVVY